MSMIPGILAGMGAYVWTSNFRVLKEEEAGGGHQARLLQDPKAFSLGPLPFQKLPLVQQMPLLKLGVNYLPSVFIAGVNFLLPPVFKFIAQLEGYTRSRQIVLILLRFKLSGVGWG